MPFWREFDMKGRKTKRESRDTEIRAKLAEWMQTPQSSRLSLRALACELDILENCATEVNCLILADAESSDVALRSSSARLADSACSLAESAFACRAIYDGGFVVAALQS